MLAIRILVILLNPITWLVCATAPIMIAVVFFLSAVEWGFGVPWAETLWSDLVYQIKETRERKKL